MVIGYLGHTSKWVSMDVLGPARYLAVFILVSWKVIFEGLCVQKMPCRHPSCWLRLMPTNVPLIFTYAVFISVPIAVPTNVRADPHNATALMVTWNPVPDTRTNFKGVLGGYRVCIIIFIFIFQRLFSLTLQSTWCKHMSHICHKSMFW